MPDVHIDALTSRTARMLHELADADPQATRMLPALWHQLAASGPVTPAQIATAADLPLETVEQWLEHNPQVERDSRGRVLGFGLTLLPTVHRIDLAGRDHTLYGWCAPDVLAIPWLLGRPGRITSRCPATDTPITAHVGADGVGEVRPAETVVSFAATLDPIDIRGSTCQRQHFFASPRAATDWTIRTPNGAVAPITDAFHAVTAAFKRAGWSHARAGWSSPVTERTHL